MKKRYFILILLFSFFLIPKNAFASGIYTDSSQYIETNISSSTGSFDYQLTTLKFSNYGNGHLTFTFSYSSIDGNTSTGDISFVKDVYAFSDNNPYPCELGTTSMNNSTHVATIYTAKCPMRMGSTGFQKLRFVFKSTTGSNVVYHLSFSGSYTYETLSDTNVNVDTSATTNAINSQTTTITNSFSTNTNRIIEKQQENTQAIISNTEEQKKTTQATNDIKNSINDDNVDNSTTKGDGFFKNFSTNSHGLSGVITSPLRMLNSLTTAQCSPLEFDLPIVHNHVSLPCMKPIYENYFGIFFSLWQLITTGLISYHICINIYKKVRDLQNPNNDRIEVLNL